MEHEFEMGRMSKPLFDVVRLRQGCGGDAMVGSCKACVAGRPGSSASASGTLSPKQEAPSTRTSSGHSPPGPT